MSTKEAGQVPPRDPLVGLLWSSMLPPPSVWGKPVPKVVKRQDPPPVTTVISNSSLPPGPSPSLALTTQSTSWSGARFVLPVPQINLASPLDKNESVRYAVMVVQ